MPHHTQSPDCLPCPACGQLVDSNQWRYHAPVSQECGGQKWATASRQDLAAGTWCCGPCTSEAARAARLLAAIDAAQPAAAAERRPG